MQVSTVVEEIAEARIMAQSFEARELEVSMRPVNKVPGFYMALTVCALSLRALTKPKNGFLKPSWGSYNKKSVDKLASLLLNY